MEGLFGDGLVDESCFVAVTVSRKTYVGNLDCSLAHKSDFAGHVIVTTGLRRMHFPRPGIFLRWNSNLQQVDFSQGFASNNILGLVVLAVNDGFLHLHV